MRDCGEMIGQIAAFFANKNGGKIDTLKLMKLFYIANRNNMAKMGHPIFFDKMICAHSGPVLQKTLHRLTNANILERHISRDANCVIHIYGAFDEALLDHLSDHNVMMMEQVWEMHGHQTDEELRYYMDNLYPEIERCNMGSKEITHLDILKIVMPEHAEHFDGEINYFEDLDNEVFDR